MTNSRETASSSLLHKMGSVVSHEVRVRNESCATLGAFIGLFPRVGSLVDSEARPLSEGLPTFVTCIRFLPIVDSLMNEQV